jgi:hypothetical protein
LIFFFGLSNFLVAAEGDSFGKAMCVFDFIDEKVKWIELLISFN